MELEVVAEADVLANEKLIMRDHRMTVIFNDCSDKDTGVIDTNQVDNTIGNNKLRSSIILEVINRRTSIGCPLQGNSSLQ